MSPTAQMATVAISRLHGQETGISLLALIHHSLSSSATLPPPPERNPSQERFMKDIGDHPERAKNLHFSFVVLLRAVRKAG